MSIAPVINLACLPVRIRHSAAKSGMASLIGRTSAALFSWASPVLTPHTVIRVIPGTSMSKPLPKRSRELHTSIRGHPVRDARSARSHLALGIIQSTARVGNVPQQSIAGLLSFALRAWCWSGGENFRLIFDFCTTYMRRQTSNNRMTAAGGGGRNDSRGEGLRGSDVTRESRSLSTGKPQGPHHRDTETAAFGRNQNLLARRRGGAEKGKIEPASYSASLRLCARHNSFCLEDLHHLCWKCLSEEQVITPW